MLSRRVLSRLVFAIECIVLALMVRQWAYVTTYRLYLDHAAGDSRLSSATQHFDLKDRQVVPSVATRGGEALLFINPASTDATLETDVESTAPARYTIAWRTGTHREVLASGALVGRTSLVQRIPSGAEILELAADGPVTWADPRVVRGMHVSRHVAALALLLFCSWVFIRAASQQDRDALRVTWFKTAAMTMAMVLTALACELTLRAFGDRAPAGVLALRHDLGESTPDERWEHSPRYGQRLRARVDAENLWQYGDIVRMGFIPAAVSPGVVHRFPFKTDAEGFRNRGVPERVDVAALGDSFTDALTVPFDASWPSRLAQRIGATVQNYGTAGFGPQQELLVLRDYALRHHPSVVVLAYFAGNDLLDAERFEDFEQSHGQPVVPVLGWAIKDVYSRADTWYVANALAASAGWLARRQQPFLVNAEAGSRGDDAPIRADAPFDRGLFTVPVRGKLLQWAFMPPYLNLLNFSEREFHARRGWRLTRDAILEMQSASLASGAQFVVMFLPFKCQVYWPLLESSVSAADLRKALTFYLEGNGRPIDVPTLRRNRLAQNTIIRELCESAGIPFLDTTDALEHRVEAGENVYFPDESHLNELGQDVVAATLADFLRSR
jgi:lysophospholipase L1-like esterase